jgi:MFS family permease
MTNPVTILGICQILGWGTSFYLPAVVAQPIANEMNWPFSWVIGGTSLGLLVAGLASRRVGVLIHRHGGRPVLIASSCLLPLGLVMLSQSGSLPLFFIAWSILGLGMGCGLYDAGFSTLGKIYGDAARRPITLLTLWGGFASTVWWPIGAYVTEADGWRGTCLVYAAAHLLIGLPLYIFAVPRAPSRSANDIPVTGSSTATVKAVPWLFPILAASITVGSALVSITAIHLLTILQAQEIALATAVALGMLIGPSQVGARIVEIAVGGRYHPIWTLGVSMVLMTAGLALISSSPAIIAFAIVIYGSGVGLQSIARGTVPLALYGKDEYALVIGRLAMFALIAQSVSPTLAALLFEAFGVTASLHVLTALAAINVALVALLGRISRT